MKVLLVVLWSVLASTLAADQVIHNAVAEKVDSSLPAKKNTLFDDVIFLTSRHLHKLNLTDRLNSSLTSYDWPSDNVRRITSCTGDVIEYKRRLPNAIIVGVKKGGTRALLEFLRIHPDVRAPGPEVHFFDKNYLKGLEWYRSRMPVTSPCQVTIEKTPRYFVTNGVAGRVYNMSRDVRVLVVVRDPVRRAVSDYVQWNTKHPGRHASFESRAFNNASSSWGSVASSWGPLRIGLYAKHLQQWLEYFPLSRIHFVHGERLVDNPAGEIRLVEKFLGLRPFVDERHFYFNATKGFPCLRVKRRRSLTNDDVIKITGSGKPTTARCLGKNKGRTHPNIEPEVIRRLRDFYRPHNKLFYRLTGVDFGWP